jgi:hypothetical protein
MDEEENAQRDISAARNRVAQLVWNSVKVPGGGVGG